MNVDPATVQHWGVLPTLFKIGNIEISSYSFMVLMALIVGGIIYYVGSRKETEKDENAFYIPIAALIGGILGAKIPEWIGNYSSISDTYHATDLLFTGRTIVGGLIGGMLSVLLVKKLLGIKGRRGNFFAPAVAAGLAIGRVGCFMGGCCYGVSTSLPWGVNFGDNIPRHPTQLYEAAFALGMFIYLEYKKKNSSFIPPGKLFDIFLNSYFIFRFSVEFIRVHPPVLFGLTLYQLLSLAALIYINRRILFLKWRSS